MRYRGEGDSKRLTFKSAFRGGVGIMVTRRRLDRGVVRCSNWPHALDRVPFQWSSKLNSSLAGLLHEGELVQLSKCVTIQSMGAW